MTPKAIDKAIAALEGAIAAMTASEAMENDDSIKGHLLREISASREALTSLKALKEKKHPIGARYRIEHDGFQGTVIGHYKRLDGYKGVVMQMDNAKIVHVYGEKWLVPVPKEPDEGKHGSYTQ